MLTCLLIKLTNYWVWFTKQWARRFPVRSETLRYTNLSCARFLNMLLQPGILIWLKMC